MGCTSSSKTDDSKLKKFTSEQKLKGCHGENNSLEQRHLAIAAKNKVKVFSRCFDNFIKFEKNKNQKFYTCMLLTIHKNGAVKYVYSRGQFGTEPPKDLKMCIEQEMWGMDFSGLQLGKSLTVRFPVEFNSH